MASFNTLINNELPKQVRAGAPPHIDFESEGSASESDASDYNEDFYGDVESLLKERQSIFDQRLSVGKLNAQATDASTDSASLLNIVKNLVDQELAVSGPSGRVLLSTELKTCAAYPVGHPWYTNSRLAQALCELYSTNAPVILLSPQQFKVFAENLERDNIYTHRQQSSSNHYNLAYSESLAVDEELLKAMVICLCQALKDMNLSTKKRHPLTIMWNDYEHVKTPTPSNSPCFPRRSLSRLIQFCTFVFIKAFGACLKSYDSARFLDTPVVLDRNMMFSSTCTIAIHEISPQPDILDFDLLPRDLYHVLAIKSVKDLSKVVNILNQIRVIPPFIKQISSRFCKQDAVSDNDKLKRQHVLLFTTDQADQIDSLRALLQEHEIADLFDWNAHSHVTLPLESPQSEEELKYWQQKSSQWPMSRFVKPKMVTIDDGGELPDLQFVKALMLKVFHGAKLNHQQGFAPNSCIIVDPQTEQILAESQDRRRLSRTEVSFCDVKCDYDSLFYLENDDHELQRNPNSEESGSQLSHAVMNCVDVLCQQHVEFRKTLAEDVDKSSIPYYCTGYDAYMFWEPCWMCGMALLHSRIRRVFYFKMMRNQMAGAFHSIECDEGNTQMQLKGMLHVRKELNHRFKVFEVEILSSDIE
ncbi:hypothetical protein MP228_004185 [Amoeboaphelidium protococcarum]|nr:hypothetical protein MP228_004185 [Amoeboaphelidium protococcarum]